MKTSVSLLFATVGLAALVLLGCAKSDDATGAPDTSLTTNQGSNTPNAKPGDPGNKAPQEDTKMDDTKTSEKTDATKGSTAAPGAKPPKDGEEVAVITTDLGRIVLKFFPDKAPNHVKNFKKLANDKFYDGTKFHRVIKGFMIQGGDPNTKSGDPDTWGQGGPKWSVKAEFNDTVHDRGILSMARAQDPDSAGSQFFIMHAKSTFLDHKYTAFGQVVEGMDVVDKIVETPVLDNNGKVQPDKAVVVKSVKIEKWPLKK